VFEWWLREIEQKSGEVISENQLHEILSEVDLNKNAQVDLGEFLQVC
jgi:glycerol-3-phosphate dehydrogenase